MNGRLGVFQMELALTGCCFTVAHFLYVVLGLFVLIFVVMVTSGCGYDVGTELPKYADLKHETTGELKPGAVTRGERGPQPATQSVNKSWVSFQV